MTERLLTARQVAELLGFTAATVVDWAEAGRVPVFKIGGRLRFRESEILAWLETKRAGAGGDAPSNPSAPATLVSVMPSNPDVGGDDERRQRKPG